MPGPAQPYDPTYRFLWRPAFLGEFAKTQAPDVLEINSPYVAAMACLQVPRSSFGIRTFTWHSDTIDTFLRPALEPRLGGPLTRTTLAPLWAWFRHIGEGCDATFVAGKVQFDKLQAHGVPRLVHLPFGVDKDVFSPRQRTEEGRQQLRGGAPDGTRVVIAVGRLAAEKHWPLALRAFLRVRTRHKVRLVIFGDGPERPKLERIANGHPDIHFAGFEKDRQVLAKALANADVLLHTCPFETFGLGVSEALASGLPVVVPDEGGASEAPPGASTLPFRAGDEDDCTAALETMLHRLDAEKPALADATQMATSQVVSVEDYYDRLLGCYQELLQAKRSLRGGPPPW
jgi:alpha-1,6-mannosyltransferase